ncbi:MAG: carboxylesterase family protein [Desulfobacterota bacterium]|nr:carboxylesterase family protein [Thermodesulfobacteriota bacterium]MDW8001865.1 carboxylesterase family protein [Deltaproteobacteria bacterium]
MDVIVETKRGRLKGQKLGDLYVFKGVPYAEPPIGDLRWMPPKMKEPYGDIWDAIEYGSICPQPELELKGLASFKERQSEDCLYLNIYTPGLDPKKRPVMFFIHGGAFTVGSSSHPLYRKGKMALRNDIVLVTINYRLGPLGFLRLKEIGDGRINSTGNEGLMDQMCALMWVKENIEAFGGDPDNITLFGESAGGISIFCLISMAKDINLFRRIIVQSANPCAIFERERANSYARSLLKILNIEENKIDLLKDLPFHKLVKASEILRERIGELTVFSPNVDGESIKEKPLSVIKEKIREMPILIGTNANEWNFFCLTDPRLLNIDMDELYRILGKSYQKKGVKLIIDYYRQKLEREGLKPEPWRIYSQFMTDSFFLIPTLKTVDIWVEKKEPVYLYYFTWQSPYLNGILGSCHTLELGFLFGNYDERFFGSGREAKRLSQVMQDAWTSFSKDGKPFIQNLGAWSDYGHEKKVMVLGKECYLTQDPHKDTRDFYTTLLEYSIK